MNIHRVGWYSIYNCCIDSWSYLPQPLLDHNLLRSAVFSPSQWGMILLSMNLVSKSLRERQTRNLRLFAVLWSQPLGWFSTQMNAKQQRLDQIFQPRQPVVNEGHGWVEWFVMGWLKILTFAVWLPIFLGWGEATFLSWLISQFNLAIRPNTFSDLPPT